MTNKEFARKTLKCEIERIIKNELTIEQFLELMFEIKMYFRFYPTDLYLNLINSFSREGLTLDDKYKEKYVKEK